MYAHQKLTQTFRIVNCSCDNGCTDAAVPIVAVDFRKIFSYECLDKCNTSFGGLVGQTWSMYEVDVGSGNPIGNNLVNEEGYMLSGDLNFCFIPSIRLFYELKQP